MGIDLLGIKEDTGEGCCEVERRVGGVVGSQDQRIGKFGCVEGRVEKGVVVNVGVVLLDGGHDEGNLDGTRS